MEKETVDVSNTKRWTSKNAKRLAKELQSKGLNIVTTNRLKIKQFNHLKEACRNVLDISVRDSYTSSSAQSVISSVSTKPYLERKQEKKESRRWSITTIITVISAIIAIIAIILST